ncbi:MAG: hypothetical protein O7B99_06320, partial [Planctomycetota bacterium]|nr:hypothetical protein [Planctomycetota bacterium]
SARGEFGTVALDDVSLVDGAAQGRAAAALLEYEAHLHGEPATSASLKLGDKMILGGIRVQVPGARWPAATLAAEATGNGIAFRATGGPPNAELAFLVNPAATDRLSHGDSVVAGWIATTGPEGFRSYSSDFEQEQVTGLLLGRGINLMRFGFAEPVKVVTRLANTGLRVTVGLGALDAFDLQLSFQEERGEAMRLSQEAVEAERDGDFGPALTYWQRLLDTAPFESQLVARASAARARLLQEGLQKLTAVGQEVDRASFFGLADLYRQCRASAETIGAAYAGSEVEEEAARLVLRIDAQLSLFDAELDTWEKEQLEAILSVVEREEWKGLAAHVREYLDRVRGN